MNGDVSHWVNVAPRAHDVFSYLHVVSFEETNLIGNVYFARHVAWQGRCREMFLKKHAPGILDEIDRGLRLVTLRVTCDYFDELRALDEIEIRMSLAYHRAHRIGLNFDYMVRRGSEEAVVARGFQEIGCFRSTVSSVVPCEIPPSFLAALEPFR